MRNEYTAWSETLKIVSQMQYNELTDWQEYTIDGLRRMSEDQEFVHQIDLMASDKEHSKIEHLPMIYSKQWLGYAIVDTTGIPVYCSTDIDINSICQAIDFSNNSPLNNFHIAIDSTADETYIIVVYPVMRDSQTIVSLAIIVKPDVRLFPLLTSLPENRINVASQIFFCDDSLIYNIVDNIFFVHRTGVKQGSLTAAIRDVAAGSKFDMQVLDEADGRLLVNIQRMPYGSWVLVSSVRVADMRNSLANALLLGLLVAIALSLLVIILTSIFRRHLHHGILLNLQRRQATLQAHTRELQTVLTNISDAILTTDHNGTIWVANDVALSLTGFKRHQIIGHNIMSIFNISDAKTRTPYDNLINEAISRHERFVIPDDTMLTQSDGGILPIRGTMQPLFNNYKRFSGMVVTFADNSTLYYRQRTLEQGFDGFSTIIDRNPHPIIIYSEKDFRFQFVNQAAAEIMGYTKEEIMKTDVLQMTSPQLTVLMRDSQPEVHNHLLEMSQWEVLTKSGDKIMLRKSSFPLVLNGQPCRYVLFTKYSDADHNPTEQSLTQAHYKKMIELLPDAIYVQRVNGKITYVNQRMLTLIGAQSASQLINKQADMLYGDNVYDSIRMQVQKIVTNQQQSIETEREMRKIDGTSFVALITGVPFVENDEMYVQMIVRPKNTGTADINTITDNGYSQLADIGGLQIWQLDDNFNIVYTNVVLQRFVGEHGQQLLNGRNWINLFQPDDRDNRIRYQSEMCEHREAFQTEARLLAADGNYYWVLISATPNFDTLGRYIGYIGYIININRRRQAEIDMEKAKTEAEESSRLKSAFLATLSHEIRTPMNAIIGFADLLKMNLKTDNADYYLSAIQQNGYNLLSIITDTIEVSKIDTNQISVNQETFNVTDVVTDTFARYEHPQNSNIVMMFNNMLPNQLTIMSDKFKVKQILSHLLDNAVKYTQSGTVTLDAQTDTGQLIFVIADTGIGVDSRDCNRVFEKFYRVKNSNTMELRGAGLGLSICKAYTEILGGTINFESTLDVGTIVTVTLPCRQVEMHHEQPKVKFAERKGTILIAEDDEFNAVYISTILESEGYTVRIVYDGESAVNAVHDNPDIKLVLMDLQMPVMDGAEALNQIRTLNSTLPVIAQTCFTVSEFRHKMTNGNFDDVLAKPIRKEQLIQIVDKYYNGRSEGSES